MVSHAQDTGGTQRRVKVDEVASLPPGGLRLVEIGDRRVCLARSEEGELFAIDDTCTHEEESLSDGWVDGSCVECPAHNAIFDLRTGEALELPATEPVTTYAVAIEDGEVYVVVNDQD